MSRFVITNLQDGGWEFTDVFEDVLGGVSPASCVRLLIDAGIKSLGKNAVAVLKPSSVRLTFRLYCILV